jgi:hypothetical protein
MSYDISISLLKKTFLVKSVGKGETHLVFKREPVVNQT